MDDQERVNGVGPGVPPDFDGVGLRLRQLTMLHEWAQHQSWAEVTLVGVSLSVHLLLEL